MTHLINNEWIEGQGPELVSINPATGQQCWQGRHATKQEVDAAIRAARSAAESWAGTPIEKRTELLRTFEQKLKTHQNELAEAISIETGKPRWDSLMEVEAMIAKSPSTIDAHRDRRSETVRNLNGLRGVTRYKPFGVLVVFGPFNFPGHVPNGHIVPAILAGNTLVFKPSKLTPLVAQRTVELWQAAGLPSGAINLVQGGRDTGIALSSHPGHDGILLTGSYATGVALRKLMVEQTGKMLALEMGSNNPLIVHDVVDLGAAAYLTIQSAYITSGQRCTCARRLIVPYGSEGDQFIEQLATMIGKIGVGPYTYEPEPFMGPLITEQAAGRLLATQDQLIKRGGKPLVRMQRLGLGPAFLSPGLVDVTGIKSREDREVFGPLLQLIRVDDFNAAIDEANNTAYGLAAALLSDNRALWEQFFRRIRAGVIHWNRQTTGASGRLPFGGIGFSGNHRPGGYFAIDYCSYPTASVELDHVAMPNKLTPGIEV
jgi:succinylglutamic semialdehyde dehydrogenase